MQGERDQEIEREKEIEWRKNLMKFIEKTLKPVIKNDKFMKIILSDKAMDIWEAAFTHETYSPNNYEELEFLGDACLKYIFPEYLMKRFPTLHKKEYTELNIIYQSKMKQGEFAIMMGLGKYVRTRGLSNVILNIQADLYESFFGALDKCGDLIAPGLGNMFCKNMIISLYSNENIDISKGLGSSKTRLIQIFTRFDLPEPMTNISNINTDKGEMVKMDIMLPQENILFLRKQNIFINDPIVGSAIGETKKKAEVEAYQRGIETLRKYGVTSKWAEDLKTYLDFSDPEIKSNVQRAIPKMDKTGIDSLYFFIPRNTSTQQGAIVQLIGIPKDGSSHRVLETILTENRDNSYKEAKKELVRMYTNNN